MPSTYSTNLKIELMATGENSGTWGTVTNTNLGTALEQAIVGYGNPDFVTDANLTITLSDSNSLQAARALVLNVTSTASLTVTRELIVPTIQKQYIVQNNTSGSQSITVKTSAGTGVTIPNGKKMHVYVNGTDVVQMDDFALIFNVDNLTLDGNTLSSTNTNGNIVLAPNGNGDVQLDADTVRVGDSNVNVTITSNGTADLILNTNAGTNSGSITIQDGVDGNIVIAPNGNGQVQISNAVLDLTTIEVTNIKAKDGTAAMSIADSTGVVSITANPILSGGTANGVVYLNASKVATSGSALTFDGSEIFKNSGGTIQNNDVRGSAAAGTRLSAGGTLGVDSFDVFQNAVGGYVFNRGNTPLIFGANNAEKMRLTSTGTLNIVGAGTAGSTQAISFNGSTPVDTLVTDSSGRVGIGISSPGAKLDIVTSSTIAGVRVNNTTAGKSGMVIQNNGSTVGIIGLTGLWNGDSDTNFGLYAETGSDIRFSTNGVAAPKAIIDTSGNLGLGVTPSAWNSNRKAIQSGNASLFSAPSAASYSAVGANVFNNTGGTDTYIGSAAASLYLQNAGAHSWYTAPSGTADGTAATSLTSTQNGNSYTIVTAGTTDFTLIGAANNNVGTVFTKSGGTGAGTGTVSQNISFTQAMTLDALGNLAVGTPNPNAYASTTTFTINGTTYSEIDFEVGGTLQGYINGVSGGLEITADGSRFIKLRTENTERARISSDGTFRVKGAGTAGTTDAVQFSGSAPASAMTLDASGNLGIGTTTTTSAFLNIANEGPRNEITFRGTPYTNVFSETTNGFQLGISSTGSSAAMEFLTNNAERARITSGGYFKASDNGTYTGISGTYHEFNQSANSGGLLVNATNASYSDIALIVYAARNTTNNSFYALSYYNTGAAAYKFRVADSGAIATAGSISLGTVTPATSGIGVQFPATQSASSNANTLDDYEEGTWTPAISGLTLGNGTASGQYTKVGDSVSVQFKITLGSTSSVTSLITLSGLPFSISGFVSSYVDILDSGTIQYSAVVSAYTSASTADIRGLRSNGTYVDSYIMSTTDPMTWTDGDCITASFTYKAS